MANKIATNCMVVLAMLTVVISAPLARNRGRARQVPRGTIGLHGLPHDGRASPASGPTHFLAGSDSAFRDFPAFGIFYPPNLTPRRETGLGAWSEQDIVTALRTGARPDGRELRAGHPWRSYATLTDQDVQAIAVYLKSCGCRPCGRRR